MLIEGTGERLVVYAPQYYRFSYERLRTIVSAAKRVAQNIGLQLDGVLRRNTLAVSVYYENKGKENWVYSDWEKNFGEEEIYNTIRDLTFILKHVHHRNSEEEVLCNV